jgi:CBS-domain-containing membrane protein
MRPAFSAEERTRLGWPSGGVGQNGEHEGFEHVVQLFQKLRMHWLVEHFPPRVVHAVYVLVKGFFTIAILALLAFLTRNPFVFPSVGPTAYLLFFSPLANASCPRNAILGHGIGLVCGYAALRLTGASAAGGIASAVGMHPGIYWPRIMAAAQMLYATGGRRVLRRVSQTPAAAMMLSATGALMVLLRISHPPAGATTLIVSLGIISQPAQLVVVEAAVFLLVLQALAINRLAGIPYPLWAPNKLDRLREAPSTP